MEFEKIVSTLREKVGQTSLSDKTFTDYVTAFKPAEGTEPDEAFFELHSNVLRSMGGNLSHSIATQVNAFKDQWAKDHPTQQQQQQQNNDNPDMKAVLDRLAALEGKQPEPDPALKALSDQLAALNSRLDNEGKEKAIKTMMSAVQAKATDLKVQDAPTWELAVEMVSSKVTSETTSAQAEEMVKTQYEALIKRLHPGGAKAYGDSDGGSQKSEIQTWLEEMKKKDERANAARAEILKGLK